MILEEAAIPQQVSDIRLRHTWHFLQDDPPVTRGYHWVIILNDIFQ